MPRLAAILTILSLSASAQGEVLAFDDLPFFQHVGEGYASKGAHFAPTDFGVMGGTGNGDPGNWFLHGTNGSAFMGFNSISGYSMEITFDTEVSAFSLDASPSNGSFTGLHLHAEFWIGSAQVYAAQIPFAGVNDWRALKYAGPTDRVTFRSTYGSSRSESAPRPYGVDNIRFVVPSPATGLIAFSAVSVLCVRRRRKEGP